MRAAGPVAAHTIRAGGVTCARGAVIPAEDAARLARAGVETRRRTLEPGDVGEDEAAGRLAAHLAGAGLHGETPFTGRCNLFAATPGSWSSTGRGSTP